MRRTSLLYALLALAFALLACGEREPRRATRSCALTALRAADGACIPASRIRVPGIEGSGARPDGYTPSAPPRELRSLGSKHVSVDGLHFIEGFEGFGACPYWDPYGGVWTRGYGETEGIGRGSPCISRAAGERSLRSRIERFYEWALRSMATSFSQPEWDALCSFAWNLGAGIFRGTLRRALEHHDPTPMLAYVHAGGVVLAGLVRRRRAEVALFRSRPRCDRTCKRRELYGAYRRRSTLRRVLASRGCRRRRREHQRLGPTCRRWFGEGDRLAARIRQLHNEGLY